MFGFGESEGGRDDVGAEMGALHVDVVELAAVGVVPLAKAG